MTRDGWVARLAWRARLARRRLRPARDERIVHIAVNGYQLIVRATEDVGFQARYRKEFERAECTLIGRLLRETETCIDVGANVGLHTLLMATRARQGIVHAFEPVELNYHLMMASVALNDLGNVRGNCCAVGQADGEVDFRVAADSAYSSFVDTGRRALRSVVRVPVVTLDGYCAEHVRGPLAFVKVDVEGAEPRVLDGARRLLADPERRPRVLMLELYGPMLRVYGSTIEEVVERLRALEYRPFVSVDGAPVPFERSHHDRLYNVFFAAGAEAFGPPHGR